MLKQNVEETLADRLVRAREAAGFSTAQLARRIGVRTKTLSDWEAGKAEPRANRLVMTAGLLNVSPTWLLVGQGSAPHEGATDLALVKGEVAQLRSLHAQAESILERLETHIAALETRSTAEEGS